MITVQPSTSFEATAQFDTGLVGTLGVRIIDNVGATTTARVTAGIIEYPATSGLYQKTLTSPGTAGQYSLVWDDGTNYATDDLLVTTDAVATVPGSNLYVTTEQLKTTLELEGTSYADDDIDLASEAACRAIDGYTDSRFYPTTETRYYTATPSFGPFSNGFTDEISGVSEAWLDIDDAVSVSSVTVDTDGNSSYETTWVEGTGVGPSLG